MYNNNDDETTTGTTGLLGIFRERINKIRRQSLIKEKQEKEEQEEFLREKVEEIKKEVAKNRKISKKNIIKKSPYKKGIFTPNKEINKGISPTDNKNNNNIRDNINKEAIKASPDEYKDEKNNLTPKDHIKKGLKTIFKGNNINEQKKTKDINVSPDNNITTEDKISQIDKDAYIEDLKGRIITQIKADFSKKLAELQVLENELYILKEQNEYELELEKIKEIKEKINEAIKKINEIISEYNIYRTSYNLSNAIDLNDTLLIDDIVEYRFLVESDSLNKEVIKEYKLLEEFQQLYDQIEKIRAISDELINNNQEKISEYENRDSKYEDIKQSVNILDETMTKCTEEIDKQNSYLDDLMSKINDITRDEITHYRFNIFNNLLNSSLLFIGTLSLSKKLPVVPRIFINTMAANHLVRNLYQSMEPQRTTEIKYSAINYDKEISNKINDVDYTSTIISDTLSTINSIKSEFLNQYNSEIEGYTETLTKINKIEELVMNSQYKIETVKEKLSKSRNQNQQKILKIDNLNKNSQIN